MYRVVYAFFIFTFFVFPHAYADKITKENKVSSERMCGGIAGIQCSTGEWCDFPENVKCGVADFAGVCRKRPEICTEQYLPVCGCDGKTYSNDCYANRAGTDVASQGKCS